MELAELRIGDRRYELHHRPCTECDQLHYRVYRYCGLSFSCYRLEEDFEVSDFEAFARTVDKELVQSSADLLEDFKFDFDKANDPSGMIADFSREFLLMEYARHRLSKLQKMDLLKTLLSREPPTNEISTAVRLGFELGAAVTEHRIMTIYEDYFWAGIAMEDWRADGLPKAREERLRQGARTRSAILDAAASLYRKSPDLLRNDTETARAIQKLDLPQLQHNNGRSISIDAITKHLRAARKSPQTCRNS